MLPQNLVKFKSPDAACRIVNHTHNTSNGSCQSHPLINGKTEHCDCVFSAMLTEVIIVFASN